MNAPRVKLTELREELAVAIFIAGAIANVAWLGIGAWMLASGLIHTLVFLADRLR